MFYTWEEIKKHNTKDDSWIVISGEIFDITEFVKNHTGGVMPLFGGGKDVTHLFKSIHPPKVDIILKSKKFRDKYYIGDVYNYKNDECKDFKKLREKVWKDLNSRGIDIAHKKNYNIILKTFFFIIFYLYFYIKLYKKQNYFISILFGIVWGIILLAQHEISHYYTNKKLPILEKILVFILPILTGASHEQFTILHAIDHHQNVGIENKWSVDIVNDFYNIIRVYKNTPCNKFTKYQHYYFYLLLPFLSIGGLITDIITLYQNKNKITNTNKIKLIFQKLLFIYLIFILPLKKWKKKWIPNLIIILCILSISIVIFEYFNHSDEETTNIDKNKCWNNRIRDATVNWDKNDFRNTCTYGLDKHVEHHFFPTISSNNLKYITPYLKNYNIKEGYIQERNKAFHKLLKKRAKECK